MNHIKYFPILHIKRCFTVPSTHFVFALIFELRPVLPSESMELVILEGSFIIVIAFVNATFVNECPIAVEHLVAIEVALITPFDSSFMPFSLSWSQMLRF